MTTFKTETYRNHVIEYRVNEEGLFKAWTEGLGYTHFQGDVNGYSKNIDAVKKQMITKIDNFRTNAPITIGELAERIKKEALVWDSYEDSYIDVKLLEVLVENYILATNE